MIPTEKLGVGAKEKIGEEAVVARELDLEKVIAPGIEHCLHVSPAACGWHAPEELDLAGAGLRSEFLQPCPSLCVHTGVGALHRAGLRLLQNLFQFTQRNTRIVPREVEHVDCMASGVLASYLQLLTLLTI